MSALLTGGITVAVYCGLALANSAPVVSNVMAQQRAESYLVDVTYDVSDADGDLLEIKVYLSVDGGATFPIQCVTLVGDVGPGVAPGIGRSFFWSAADDYPGYVEPDCRIRVIAEDGSVVPVGYALIPPLAYSMPVTFTMGSPTTETGRYVDEVLHSVTLTRRFLMKSTEVTKQEYLSVMGTNPSYFPGYMDRPVDMITWVMAVEFCNAKSAADGLTPCYSGSELDWSWNQDADGWRLPTEAEWEFACRAGTSGRYWSGTAESNLGVAGWYYDNSGGRAHDAGEKGPSAWGLSDTHGNLQEWCWDGYAAYPAGPVTDPVGSGVNRVYRGGSWYAYAQYCRSASRFSFPADYGNYYNGFRIVRTIF